MTAFTSAQATAYLGRIGYRGSTDPADETLAALQEAHLRSVPFENLDIGRGVPILLDEAGLFEKVVVRRRGGFCYELNGLFHLLLLSLGFPSGMISARVHDAPRGSYGPEFDHMALLVTLPRGRYLADVGFGEFSLRPLLLEPETILDDPAGAFRFEESAGGRTVVSRRVAGSVAFEPQYDFLQTPRRLSDFEGMCRYQQTSPDSNFTQRSVCSIVTPSGRITLLPDRIIETAGDVRTERALAGPAEHAAILEQRFGIRL